MAKTSRISQTQAKKARKQKITAAVFGAIFLVLVVIQGPRTMKLLHGSSSSPTPATTQPAATATPGASASASPTSVVTSAPATATTLEDSDQPPKRTKSQLVSFDHFESKDPFVQQVSEENASTETSSTGGAGGATASPTTTKVVNVPAGDTGGTTAPSSAPATRTTASAKAQPTRTTAAVVEVNGQRQSVPLAAAFPKANPTFKLVSLTNAVARIGIAGGKYASGAPTVALHLGRTLTLVNTADGMRYELRLVSAQ